MKGDEVWTEAERAYGRSTHSPSPMLQVSTGPLYSYCCPICAENGSPFLEKSVTSSTMTCYGGYEFV